MAEAVTPQPKALALADALNWGAKEVFLGVHKDSVVEDMDKASAELHRQHAEIERLRADAERGRFLLDLMEAHGLLSVEFCRPEAGQTETGYWWVLFPPYGVDRMRAPLGYAKTPEGAIDAARKAKG